MFIVAVVQHIKIGDLSLHPGASMGDIPDDALMDVDRTDFPEGTDIGDTPVLSKEDERALVRDNTASFAGK